MEVPVWRLLGKVATLNGSVVRELTLSIVIAFGVAVPREIGSRLSDIYVVYKAYTE